MKQVRCAIYTRKSSEEGLEQDFNSLDAQREACAAYIASQASEGWRLVDEHYDDGGISGGTLERAGLQQLLSDVQKGRIDIIVVYKVDRLTRSLLDFAKLVEAFDEAEVSFVSVTQSFNTTTSMGRLTLNMLLSFAQFEREVTAERIRDKIAQSKARGMWMGGTPPLGYEPDGKNSLVIVEEHAELIRDIYARYRRLSNVRHVSEELKREGIGAPQRTRRDGSTLGGCAFTRGQLYYILKNPVYAGNIPHKGKVHSGNHAAIIEPDTWDAVQQQLAQNARGVRKAREKTAALLASKLYDSNGEALIPVHTSKPASSAGTRRRYLYYVTKGVHHDAASTAATAMRIPAKEIEHAVFNEMAKALADPLRVTAKLQPDLPPHLFEQASGKLSELCNTVRGGGRNAVRQILKQVVVHADRIEIEICSQGLAGELGLKLLDEAPDALRHVAAIRLSRSGQRLKLVDENGVSAGARSCDPSVLRLLVQARKWWGELARGEIDIAKLSRREGVTASWMTRVVRLAFLAPKVVDAALVGRLPAKLDGKSLLAPGTIAADWSTQTSDMLAR